MHPWERQQGEREQWWNAFKIYLESRNKAHTSRETGMTVSRIYQIAKEWDWPARCTAYDNWMQGAEDKVYYEGREQLAREHLEVIRKARHVADKAISTLLKALRNEDAELAPKDALAYLEKAVTLERLVTGEATERTESYDLSKLSGDEAEALLETLEKLQ